MMVCLVAHSLVLVTSLSRVILLHYDWCLDMPNLTDVYLSDPFDYKNHVTIRGSTHFISLSRIGIGALRHFFKWLRRGTWLLSLCHTSHSSSCESPSFLCKYSHNGHSNRKWNQCIQNRWNSRSSSFSKTIWNRYISHSVVTCIPFCHHRKRFVFSPFTLISVSVLVWITSQMAFVRDCGYNQFRWVSWVRRFYHPSSLICCYTLFKHCVFHFVANQWFILCGTKQVWWVGSDCYGKGLCVFFPSSWVVMVCILVVCDSSTSSMKK